MKLNGIFKKAEKPAKKADEPFFLRLVEASSYPNSVAVEAVNKYGERLSLIYRISKEMGIEAYEGVDPTLGFPMCKENSVVVHDEETC